MSLCSKPHTWLIIWLGIKFWIGSHIPLEQCCLVDLLQWWNCFISALSTMVATSQCGYWMLDMWHIYTWGTEFFILFHFTLNLNSCMWQWALAHWRHCFIFLYLLLLIRSLMFVWIYSFIVNLIFFSLWKLSASWFLMLWNFTVCITLSHFSFSVLHTWRALWIWRLMSFICGKFVFFILSGRFLQLFCCWFFFF